MPLVIGCGVSGLSCALLLLRAGHSVDIWARELPPATTSNVAAAFWYPYQSSPQDRATTWARKSWETYRELAHEADIGVVGVSPREVLEIFPRPAAEPWWRAAVDGFRRAEADERPPGYADGYVFDSFVVDTRKYLPWLLEQVRREGARIEVRHVMALDQALAHDDAVFNCAGLGAKRLVPDATMLPIRGQVVHVRNPGLERVVLDEHSDHGIAYIVPRGDECVLGGTAIPNEDSVEPDPAATRDILEHCAKLEPRLRGATVLGSRVGLRPGRPHVRLELERRSPGIVIHDYGHAGSGITLSWGCAYEAVALYESARGSS